MVGIVSLLDPASDAVARGLWGELAREWGLRLNAERVPFPHVSYHVAERYDLERVAATLARAAARTQPFTARVTGLGAFTAPEPTLYLAVERGPGLEALHATLWEALATEPDLAQGVMGIYAAATWIPHITLAQRDLTPATLDAPLAAWAKRDLRRKVVVDNLTLLYAPPGDAASREVMRFALGLAGAVG